MKTNDSQELRTRLDYFKKVSLFKDLDATQITRMIGVMTIQRFPAGEIVFREGSSGDALFILLEGEVEISKSLVLPEWIQSAQKQEKSLVRLSEKHYPFFGEMAMFGDQGERSASIKATRPCLMACITKAELIRILGSDPAIGMIVYRNIASVLVERLRKANRDILKLTTAFTLALEE